ncbi:hypothetical protein [Streptomyces mirabilis]|uniref:Uncharacterized protein n=1 Tax=Streptomyces mirabilis TaxID=68239 RepID=A0A1I2S619_9ACTN|nr:hypothetical protein SAMN02787118_12150 [Streptomyces mirabilis]
MRLRLRLRVVASVRPLTGAGSRPRGTVGHLRNAPADTLGDFLRVGRSRLEPSDVGLPVGGAPAG